MEVIPLEHIGTDPNAATGFMNRRYDLSATGLTNAELQAALRPLLHAQLLRDVRFRLREIVRLSADRGEDSACRRRCRAAARGDYPDPESAAIPRFPPSRSRRSMRRIDRAIRRCRRSCRTSTARPADPLRLRTRVPPRQSAVGSAQGRRNIESTLAALDVTELTEGVALNLVGILIKNRFYADNGVDYAAQQCLEGFGTLDLPQQIAGYKPRPLEGVWATRAVPAQRLGAHAVPDAVAAREARHEVLRRPARIRSRARGLRDDAR